MPWVGANLLMWHKVVGTFVKKTFILDAQSVGKIADLWARIWKKMKRSGYLTVHPLRPE